jgi:hypothetical protein
MAYQIICAITGITGHDEDTNKARFLSVSFASLPGRYYVLYPEGELGS